MPAPLVAAKLAWQAAGAAKQARNGKGPLVGGAIGAVVLILFALAAIGGGVATLVGQCNDESAAPAVDAGPITARAREDIPTRKTTPSIVTLDTLTRLSAKLDIDWHFVASIAAQECNFGRCATVNAVNGSGCVGPMQLGVGGACGDYFGRNKTDGDGDGRIDPRGPEDAVATAIRGLKDEKGAPGRGGSYAQYRQASCGYYGACADGLVNYADEVMARAVAYGFRGPGAPSGGNLDEAAAANAAPVSDAAPERTMLNLGDSLAVGIEEPLKTSLSGWTIESDVAGSRPTARGLERLSARDPGSLPTVLVVSLGTNDSPRSTTAFRRHVNRVLEIAGPQRCVVWPTIRRPPEDGVSYAAMNRVLTTAAADASNMRVLDSSTIPGIGDDGVHYSPAGYRARSNKIAAAAEECIGSLMLPGAGDAAGCADDSNLAVSAGGAAELQRAITLRSPRSFRGLPLDLVAGGFGFQQVDSRIYANAVYILRTYNLRVTAAREAGHSTHGDGTALDIVPAGNLASQAVWDASAGRLAADLGWKPGACARNGRKPVCAFVPAILAVFYDDFPSHGSPRTCQGRCPQHIHVSWESDTYGTSGLGPPPGWVKVFPVPSGFDDGGGVSS